MIYRFGAFEIDTREYQLRRDGTAVDIEPKVFDLLVLLVERPGRVITRDDLFDNLWPGQVVSDASLSNQIRAARKACGDDGRRQSVIKTIHGRGYQFVQTTVAEEHAEPASATPNSREDDTRPSIAVLPFVNLSGDPDQVYFSDGISEDIITELSRFAALFVIARNSSFLFRDSTADSREIAHQLGVRFLLEGSVRKLGDRVRITAQLIDGGNGNQIWAERYDRELIDVFAVQDEIAGTIVSTISGRIDEFDLGRIADKSTDSLSAYECLLRGKHLMHHNTDADFRQAQLFFDQALKHDPNYPRAHAFKAYLEFLMWVWGGNRQRLEAAQRYGATALQLDDNESKSHLAVGVAQLFQKEFEKAEYHLRRAAALNPNDDLIMIEFGRLLIYLDAPLEGAKIVERAMRQNPYHPNWYWHILGRCWHTAGEYRQAITALERVSDPRYWTRVYLAACYAEVGETEKATMLRDSVMAEKPDFTISGFAELFPYRNDKLLASFISSHRKAGFPE